MLRKLTRDSPRQQERLAKLEPLLEQGISLIKSKRATAGIRTQLSLPQRIVQARGGAALGIGLAGMRERLAEFGGQINVESSGAGSTVEAVIPTGGMRHEDQVPTRAALA